MSPPPPPDDRPTAPFDPLPDTAPANPPAGPVAPAAVPGYEILGELGRGGMGVVYKARQVAANRVVALKMIPAGQFASDAQRRRFRAEAEAAAALDHPGIVPIYDTGEAPAGPYFSMKLVAGRSLREALADPGWLPDPATRAALLAKVARAVHHAHQRGVIHRDLKPANILLDEHGEPLVTDFGLAKRVDSGDSLTHTNAVIGTPAYMPPEQAAGESKSVTTLADVYSLGAVLYELLAGRPPFTGETPFAIAQQVLVRPPDPPSRVNPAADKDLEAVCLKCLEKDSAARYPSAEALAEDLDRWTRGEPLSVRPPSAAYLAWRWVRANVRTAVWVALIGFVCTLIGGGLVAWQAMVSLFDNASITYDKFPSEPKPWLLRLDWATARAVAEYPATAAVGWVLTAILLGGMGLFAAWVARPRDRWADLSLGLGLGFVSGQTLMFCGVMQAVMLAEVIVPHLDEYIALSEGCFARTWPPPERDPAAPPEHPADRLAREHPDLRAAETDADRGQRMMAHVVADQVVGVFHGVWYAGIICWVSTTISCVVQALIAGHLFRRHGRFARVWPRYLVLTLASYPALGLAFEVVTRLGTDPGEPWLVIPFALAALGLGWGGVFRGWPIGVVLAGLIYLALGYAMADALDQNPLGLVVFLAIYLAPGCAAAYLWGRRWSRRPAAAPSDPTPRA
jgi:tRNA A-37 threonylcarbamoyl transferase component Bud32